MSRNNLKSLSRSELLKLLLEQTKNANALRRELDDLKRKIEYREVISSENGEKRIEAVIKNVESEYTADNDPVAADRDVSDKRNAGYIDYPAALNGKEKETEIEDPDHLNNVAAAFLKEAANRQRNRVHLLLVALVLCLLTLMNVIACYIVLTSSFLRISDNAMAPFISSGETVVAKKNSDFSTGDVVGIRTLSGDCARRIIAAEGDWVDIREDGSVSVNDELIRTVQLEDTELLDNLELPLRVAEGQFFALGDSVSSADARDGSMLINSGQVMGRITFRLLPFAKSGFITDAVS